MKCYKYTLNMGMLNFIAILLFFICLFIVGFIYGEIVIHNPVMLVSLGMLYFILHELVHYVGFIINKEVKSKNVVLGAEIEKGVLYCMCKQEIHKKTIMISIFAPLVVMGIITLIIGMYFHLDLLIILSITNISGSTGDLMMGLFLLKLPKDIKYIDFDDCTSFCILSKKDLTKYKMLGIKFIESIPYTKDIGPKDFKKISISKTSLWIFIILIIITIVGGIFL